MIYLEIENQHEPSIQRKKRKEKKSEFQPEMAIPVVYFLTGGQDGQKYWVKSLALAFQFPRYSNINIYFLMNGRN